MRRILIGTGNRKKQGEIRALLVALPVEAITPADLDTALPAPAEDGTTFEDNARLKALAYARASGLWTIADDSGLVVDALGGRPGVHSARFAGPGASDDDNNRKLIAEMERCEGLARAARYVSVVVVARPEGILSEARGECPGTIRRTPRGDGGFGYDPYFQVPGGDRTFAELSPAQKNAISHRGRAMRRILPALASLLGAPPPATSPAPP